MSDLSKECWLDEQEYRMLCKQFGEDLVYYWNDGIEYLDVYGEHSKSLKQRKKEITGGTCNCNNCTCTNP